MLLRKQIALEEPLKVSQEPSGTPGPYFEVLIFKKLESNINIRKMKFNMKNTKKDKEGEF